MGTMGLLSGRSRHATRKPRSHSSRTSIRPKKTKKDGEETEREVPKPDLDELRQRRAEYYSVSPQERRRISSTSTLTSRSKLTSKPSLVSSSRSASTSDRRHKSRRHKSSSRDKEKAARQSSDSQRNDEYVYAPRPSAELDPIVEEPPEDKPTRRHSEKRRSRHSSPSRRRSLPIVEEEVTPEDSISQVGERSTVSSRRSSAYVRPSLRRSTTTSAKLERVPEARIEAESVRSSSKRSSKPAPSLSGSTVRRHSTTCVPDATRLVECLTCGSDDIPVAQSAKLACGHRMCQDCLKRIFEMSVKDPAHMPPRCCSEDHIPLRHVDKLFDVKFKLHWNRKYQEYKTKNRIYCPTLTCGEWIKPTHIHSSQGRKYAQCPRCKTKVCVLCNNKMHRSAECPKDPEIAKLVEQAKEKGWQRCYSCSAFVERKEGCNHMTCRCLAEFCIVCGLKWKTCDCPWFNYSNLPNPDRLNDMRVPEPIQMVYRQVFRAAADGMAAAPPPEPVAGNRRGPLPEVTYQQEMDQRRRQERLDADLARRLQLATLMEGDDELRPHRRTGDMPDPLGLGNAARHFMNDDFVQNAANVVMSAFGDTNLGRRGERASGRRRRARPAGQNDGDPGLADNFLGDESVVGGRAERRYPRNPEDGW